MIAAHLPDVAVLDITMPGLNGIEVITRLHVEQPQVRVICLSMHDNEEYVRQALRAGASAYLLKDSSPHGARARGPGGRPGRLVSQPERVAPRRPRTTCGAPAGDGEASDGLTSRQREILQLIAEGRTNQQMAASLSLSIKTIETHRAQLMDRLDIHDVAGLVRYAIRSGLIPADR